MIEQFFYLCVRVLEVVGDLTGMGYFLANIVIFVILHPVVTILFFYLWRKEKQRRFKSKMELYNE
jgi:hypothetical protein